MNNTITLSQLITRLAKATGVDNNTARRFLRSFFETIEKGLEVDGEVAVKGFGTFKMAETSDGTGKMAPVFVPDSAFLEEINRPFEMFEPVELADGVDFSEVEEPVESENVVAEEPTVPVFAEPEEIVIMETAGEPVVIDEAPIADSPEHIVSPPDIDDTEPVLEIPPVEVAEESEAIEVPEIEQSEEVPEEERDEVVEDTETVVNNEQGSAEEETNRKRRIPVWAWAAVFVVAVCSIAFWAAICMTPIPTLEDYEEEEEVSQDTVSTIVEELGVEDLVGTTSASDTIVHAETAVTSVSPTTPANAVEEAPKQVQQDAQPVYDVVEVSLIRLAKKHYGISEYWVFIFDANRDKIKNPNRIMPGTKVLIPSQSSLPGSSLEETKAIAKKKQTEYNSQF